MMEKSSEVTQFLDGLAHPMRPVIEELRSLMTAINDQLVENIKWNGPNYTFNGEDRITMRIHPPKQVQLIFHRGAKVKEQPKTRLIEDKSNLLEWRGNDRAIIGFKTVDEIKEQKHLLLEIIEQWLVVN